MQNPSTLPDDQRPGVTYAQAQEILARHGVDRSIRTLQRWVDTGTLRVKRITHQTVILFRDEVEALAKKDAPKPNLTIPEALAYLAEKGVQTSYRSLRRWISFGIVRVVKVRGRSRWVSRASLDELTKGVDVE